MDDTNVVQKLDLSKIDWKSSREFFQSLSDELRKLDDKDEKYDFTWVGKRKSIIEAGTPINKTLRPDVKSSKNWDTTQNLFIEGDNLDALKLLQEAYLGKVKMVYIDPPYNTGKDFVYHDNFKADAEQHDEATEYKDDEGNIQFKKNEKSNGRYHSDWLSMMYPRLKLARNLLSDDGIIFISIDDNEQVNLKRICDEIFGIDNFVTQFIWEGAGKNDARYVSIGHDYILCYTKCLDFWKDKGLMWRLPKEGLDEIYKKEKELRAEFKEDYTAMGNALKEWYKSLSKTHSAWQHRHYSGIDKKGVYFPGDISWPGGGGPSYPVIHPLTKKIVKLPARGWVYSSPTKMQEAIETNKIEFGVDETTVPKLKRYLIETEGYVPSSVIYLDRRGADKRLRALFSGKDVFDSPKDENLLAKLLAIGLPKGDDLIVDFFSGSATTAHAVMQLNAKDGGNRKWIMVQLPEVTPEGSEARKAGYATIPDIARERIRRAGDKIAKEYPEAKVDYGFRSLVVTDSNFKDVFKPVNEITQKTLLDTIDNIKEERTELDLLFGVLVQLAFELNRRVEIRQIDGSSVYLYDYLGETSGLVACFSDSVSEQVIKQIAELKPLIAVFRDSSFTDSQAKVNLGEHFRVITPETKIRVI